jgi:hypothetical protein
MLVLNTSDLQIQIILRSPVEIKYFVPKKTSDSVYQKVSVIIYTLYVIVEYKVEMNIPHLYKHFLTDK